MRRIAPCCFALILAVPAPALAQTPLGPPLRISGSEGIAGAPEIAANRRGDTVVVWVHSQTDGRSSIHGLAAPPDGLDQPLLVADIPSSRFASVPGVAVADDGSFVVIWRESDRVNDSNAAFRARSFTAAGLPRSAAWTVAQVPDDGIRLGSAMPAFGPDGNLVIAWSASRGLGFDNFNSFGRWFAADGTPRSPVFGLHLPSAGTHVVWSVAVDRGGSLFAVWITDDATALPALRQRLVGQLLGPDGSRRSEEIWITPALSWDLLPSQVLWEEETDSFRVVWAECKRVRPGEIFTRRFAADGLPLGPRVRLVNGSSEGSVAPLPDGGFVLVWESEPGRQRDLLARTFRANGKPAGAVFRVSARRQGAPARPRIAADDAGDLTVVWQNLPSATPAGVFLRRFALP